MLGVSLALSSIYCSNLSLVNCFAPGLSNILIATKDYLALERNQFIGLIILFLFVMWWLWSTLSFSHLKTRRFNKKSVNATAVKPLFIGTLIVFVSALALFLCDSLYIVYLVTGALIFAIIALMFTFGTYVEKKTPTRKIARTFIRRAGAIFLFLAFLFAYWILVAEEMLLLACIQQSMVILFLNFAAGNSESTQTT